MEVRKFKPKQAVQFIPCGWRLWKKNLMTWWLVSLVLAAATMVLVQIPFVGEVGVLFMLPLAWTGSLLVADRLNNPEAMKEWRATRQVKSVRTLRLYCMKDMLVGGFAKEHRIIELLGLAASMIVLGMASKIMMKLIAGGAMSTPGHFWELAFSQITSLLAAYGALYLLMYLLMLSFFYGLPLFIIRDTDLIEALKGGFGASLKNLVPITAYLLAMFGPLVLLILLSGLSKFIFFFVFIIVISILWPLFINSQYCAYRLSLR